MQRYPKDPEGGSPANCLELSTDSSDVVIRYPNGKVAVKYSSVGAGRGLERLSGEERFRLRAFYEGGPVAADWFDHPGPCVCYSRHGLSSNSHGTVLFHHVPRSSSNLALGQGYLSMTDPAITSPSASSKPRRCRGTNDEESPASIRVVDCWDLHGDSPSGSQAHVFSGDARVRRYVLNSYLGLSLHPAEGLFFFFCHKPFAFQIRFGSRPTLSALTNVHVHLWPFPQALDAASGMWQPPAAMLSTPQAPSFNGYSFLSARSFTSNSESSFVARSASPRRPGLARASSAGRGSSWVQSEWARRGQRRMPQISAVVRSRSCEDLHGRQTFSHPPSQGTNYKKAYSAVNIRSNSGPEAPLTPREKMLEWFKSEPEAVMRLRDSGQGPWSSSDRLSAPIQDVKMYSSIHGKQPSVMTIPGPVLLKRSGASPRGVSPTRRSPERGMLQKTVSNSNCVSVVREGNAPKAMVVEASAGQAEPDVSVLIDLQSALKQKRLRQHERIEALVEGRDASHLPLDENSESLISEVTKELPTAGQAKPNIPRLRFEPPVRTSSDAACETTGSTNQAASTNSSRCSAKGNHSGTAAAGDILSRVRASSAERAAERQRHYKQPLLKGRGRGASSHSKRTGYGHGKTVNGGGPSLAGHVGSQHVGGVPKWPM